MVSREQQPQTAMQALSSHRRTKGTDMAEPQKRVERSKAREAAAPQKDFEPLAALPKLERKRLGLLLLSSLCLLVSFTLFHEVGRFYIKVVPSTMLFSSFVLCLFHSLGVLLGALFMIVPTTSRWLTLHESVFLRIAGWGLAALSAGCLYAVAVSKSAAGLCLFGTLGSAVCTMLIALLVCRLQDLPVRTIAYGLALSIGVCAFANYLLFPLATRELPAAAALAFHVAVAVCAAVFLSQLAKTGSDSAGASAIGPASPSRVAASDTPPAAAAKSSSSATTLNDQSGEEGRAGKSVSQGDNRSRLKRGLPLIVHLLAYGFTFGVLHVTVGIFGLLGPERDALELVGTLLAAGLVLATYVRNASTAREVWTNLRRLAFPLLSGFVIAPALMHSVAATVFAEAATCYYGCLFVLGCVFMMRETVVAPLCVVGGGMVFLSAGLAVGSLCGFLPFILNRTDDQFLLSASIMIAFVATTIGTFWIGDDHALRTWWGLRRNYTAKQYQDQLMRKRCEQVAREFNLSERELEVLLLLAQGRRAAQIKDDLFISINTVRVHTRNIYNKLDVHSVKQLTDIVESVVL